MYRAIPNSEETPKKRIWTSLKMQPNGEFYAEVTEEEYALLVKEWVNNWQTVYEDLEWLKRDAKKASQEVREKREKEHDSISASQRRRRLEEANPTEEVVRTVQFAGYECVERQDASVRPEDEDQHQIN